MQTAANFKKARKEALLTQGELAKRLGVKQQTVSYWETGKRAIPVDKAVEASRILGKVIIPNVL